MQTIWKYPLIVTREQAVALPKGAQILHIGVQRNSLAMWVLIPEPDTETMVNRTLVIYGTGRDILDEPLKYIGSYQLDGGTFVGHVFERLNP